MYRLNKIILPAIMSVLLLCSCAQKLPENTDTSATASFALTTSSQTAKVALTERTEVSDPVSIILSSMSAEEKAGQIILARYSEDAPTDAESMHIGGFTLYADDFRNETPSGIIDKISLINAKSDIPVFTAVDEEGGKIVRVSGFKAFSDEPFLSQLEMAEGGYEALKNDTEKKTALLKSLGINLNLAPVADVAESPDDYIYSRTFGTDAEATGLYVERIIEIMNENKLAGCLKHFPGYGSNKDTHKGMAVDERPKESFEDSDFVPFRSGIKAGAPLVMVSHNIVTAYDSVLPSSLSPAVHEVLRKELGFEGIIVSDDMGMDAIKDYSDGESPYVLAVLAGNDLICTSDTVTCYNDIISALESGAITEERLDESVRRILSVKISYGIISEEQWD